jgi:hypothetical protein
MLSSVEAGDTNAVIPYKTLDDMFQPISQIDSNKLEIRVLVSSHNKLVRPSDIHLTIQSALKGPLLLPLGTNGQLLNFPHDKKLARENPPIVVNQPKGTVQLWVTMQLPPSDALTFRYQRLGDGVAEMNKAIRAQAGLVLSLLVPKVQGVVFFFPKSDTRKATVEILSATGTKVYLADKKGMLKLKLEPALLAENPEVKVSEKPKLITPDLEGF